MTIPKITQKHWNAAHGEVQIYATFPDVCNKAIEIALAEQQESEYITAEQALKQVKWEDMPVGVAVQTVNKKLLGTIVGIDAKGHIAIYSKNVLTFDYGDTKLELAPASEQPWIPTIAPHEGLVVEYSKFSECMKITGIAKGYVLGGAV